MKTSLASPAGFLFNLHVTTAWLYCTLRSMEIDKNKIRAGRLMRLSTFAAVSVASTLVVAKSIAWWLSDSVAMLGSMTDSGLDLMASIVTLFAVRTALQPADDQHRFGHGKAEALAGLFQAAIMTGFTVFLILESLQSLYRGDVPVAGDMIIGASLLAIILTLALVMFQSYVVKHTKSLAIAGDHLHYKGDLLLNIGVIAAAALATKGIAWADGAFGLMIGAYILHGAWHVARPAIDMLMDKELSHEEREKIFNLVLESSGVRGLHDLRTRTSGRDCFIQMHVDVDGDLSVHKAHFIADEVEAIIGEEFPEAEILIHIDPMRENSSARTAAELHYILED